MSNQCNHHSDLLIFIIRCLLLLSFGLNIPGICNASPWIGNNVQPAKKNEFSFVVTFSRKVHFGRGENHFCTGSLISKIHVLTAAHCSENEKKSNIVVSIGSNVVGSGHRYEIDTWITYEEWAKQNHIITAYSVNDLMVVTLDEEVVGIEPAVISFTGGKFYRDKEVISVGWGRGNDGKIQKHLQKVYLKVLPKKKCEKELHNVYREHLEVPWSYVCTIGRNPLTIMGDGDSGGPLIDMETKKIIGVNESECTECETKDRYAVNLHLSVDYYKPFIKNFVTNHK